MSLYGKSKHVSVNRVMSKYKCSVLCLVLMWVHAFIYLYCVSTATVATKHSLSEYGNF